MLMMPPLIVPKTATVAGSDDLHIIDKNGKTLTGRIILQWKKFCERLAMTIHMLAIFFQTLLFSKILVTHEDKTASKCLLEKLLIPHLVVRHE